MIVRTPEAERDRLAIRDYLVARDPAAAVRIDRLFGDAVASLADFPWLGHPGDIPGTRKLTPHRRHRLVYEVAGETLWILALVHTARQWPPVRD